MSGFLKPDSGEIKVLGGSPDDHNIRGSIAYITPYLGFMPTLTVYRVCKSFRLFYRKFDNALFEEISKGFGLKPVDRLDALSGPQLIKLSYALAMARRPRLILADDLAGDADPFVTGDIMSALKKYLGDTSLVFTTSRIGDLDKYADGIIIISDGIVKHSLYGDEPFSDCYLISGECNETSEGAIGARFDGKKLSCIVQGDHAAKKITERYPGVTAEKAERSDVIRYYIGGGEYNE